jgi:acetyl esterase/lipase
MVNDEGAGTSRTHGRRAVLAMGAGLALCGLWPVPKAAARRSDFGISYGPAKLDFHSCGLDPAPAIIHVHGGGWRIGSRRRVHSMPAFFNGLGWHFFSIDYRLLPDHPVETQHGDVASAVRYVRDNAAATMTDPRRIVLMGHSAGAHLAALAALSGKAGPVAAFISNDTEALDVAALAERQGGSLKGLWRDAFGDDPERWRALSPSANLAGPKPKALVTWSRGRAPLNASFISRYRRAGGDAQAFDGSAYSHMSINRELGKEGSDVTRAVAAFLGSIG